MVNTLDVTVGLIDGDTVGFVGLSDGEAVGIVGLSDGASVRRQKVYSI